MLELLGILVCAAMVYLLVKVFKFVFDEPSGELAKETQVAAEPAPIKIDQSIINNAIAFAGMCRKIATGEGKWCNPVKYKLVASPVAGIDIWAVHIVRDNTLMEAARNYAMEGNRRNTELIYNQIIEKYGFTEAEMRSFQDVSGFMEFLRGGIEGYNSCKISGHDMTITQKIGSFVGEEKKGAVILEIEKAVLSRYNGARATTYGTMSLTIEL